MAANMQFNTANSAVLLALKFLMAVILAAWTSVWVLRPTKLWKKAWHSAEDGARKTILGAAGLNVIVYCYPVLSVAVLGYIYLHLLAKNRRARRKKRVLSSMNLSNPIIVHSPVGVVSGRELLAAVLFVALLSWTLYSNLSSDFKKLVQPKTLHLNRLQLKVMRVGIRFGSLVEICLAVLFLPILRGLSIFKIVGLQFETSVRYHVWIGNMLVLLAMIHGAVIMSIWAVNHRFWSEITKWQRTGRVNLAGAITLATALAIWITSLPPIRRKQFELFYSAHHLYTVFIVFFLFHGGDRHFFLVLSGILLFALDKILRIIQSKPETCLMSASLLPCRAIELTLSKHPSLKYTPTSMIFVKIENISKFQWHPFSIVSSSNMDNDRMSVIIKCQGAWTNKLYSRIQRMIDSKGNSPNHLQVAVEGPYGPATNIFQRYDSLILIAGGSGVTPFLSVLEEVGSQKDNTGGPSKIQLIYAVKRSEDLSMLTPVFPLFLNQSGPHIQVKLKAFVTQEERSGATLQEVLQEVSQTQTVSFDPMSPIKSTPKMEGLIWKAAITGMASFIFFFVLVILNHTFLPTEKKSSESKNPSWINDLLVISSFVVAASCTAVATVYVRWRRKDETAADFNEQGKGRVTNLSSKEVTGTIEDHELYFGRRPDLTELLKEVSTQKGKSEVGVFVCGPDTMQESVASSCRNYPSFAFHSLKFTL